MTWPLLSKEFSEVESTVSVRECVLSNRCRSWSSYCLEAQL
jgi:hypothetical protein